MRRLLTIALLSLSLAGCQEVQKAWDLLTQSSVSPVLVVVAVNSFDALEQTATNYLTLPRCGGTTKVCRDPQASKEIVPAVRAGRVARDNLEQFMKDHPGQLGPKGTYDALAKSIETLRSAVTKYKMGTAQ